MEGYTNAGVVQVSMPEYQIMTEAILKLEWVKEFIKKDRYYMSGELNALGFTAETAGIICKILRTENPEKEGEL